MSDSVLDLARRARSTLRVLGRSSAAQRDGFLRALAEALGAASEAIETANQQDLAEASAAGLNAAMLDRLRLDRPRIEAIARDLEHLAAMPDALAERSEVQRLPSGLCIHQRRVPIGVLGVIYESRPNVTIDVAALAIKTGNAAVLRGGKESLATNLALLQPVRAALQQAGLPSDAVQYLASSERSAMLELLKLDEWIDLIIPRGGAGLHRFCRQESRIPVITGGIGICHLYVDRSADLLRALAVIRNAKVQRPTVCNALDSVLLHRDIAAELLPPLLRTLAADGVSFRLDPVAMALVQDLNLRTEHTLPAGPEDFDSEWLALILGIRVVEDAEQAMVHIETHSSGHSDGILCADTELAQDFLARIDSAAVYWNASTRFTDGGELGLGAEVAVSTQRLHARGPMGLRELTSYKWVGVGDYLTRA